MESRLAGGSSDSEVCGLLYQRTPWLSRIGGDACAAEVKSVCFFLHLLLSNQLVRLSCSLCYALPSNLHFSKYCLAFERSFSFLASSGPLDAHASSVSKSLVE